jgi:hypothetical protein
MAHQHGRRLRGHAADGGHILEEDHLIPVWRAQHDIADGLQRIHLPGGTELDALRADQQIPRRRNQVLLAQRLADPLQSDPELGRPGRADLDFDGLPGSSKGRNPGNARHQGQFALQFLYVGIDLADAVAVTGHGEEQRVYVAEIIVDDGRTGTGRQLTLRIGDPTPQLVPDLLEVVAGLRERHRDLDLDL